MSESKAAYHFKELSRLVEAVATRENVKPNTQTRFDLDWIKYHAKQLTASCEDCQKTEQGKTEASQNEMSQNENEK